MNYRFSPPQRRGERKEKRVPPTVPLQRGIKGEDGWLGGGEEKADHPPFVPPIKGGIILIRGIAEDIILTQER